MTRRELLAVMAASKFLRAQNLAIRSNYGSRYDVPATPVARWNFHRLGQSLAEGATITSVPDDSGNGNTLTINTGLTHQTPLFTFQAINKRGAYWAGAIQPSAPMTQSPLCQAWGGFNSPSIALGNENAISVLWCAQMGASTLSVADDGKLMGIGGTISAAKLEWWQRGSNGQTSKSTHWSNAATGHGALARIPWINFGGPNAGAFVNGFGGTGGNSCYMANRLRNTANLGWNATSLGTNPIYVGSLLSTSTDDPHGCLWHEVAVYNRVITAAELDMWQIYCNQMYASPLIASGGGTSPYIVGRVILCGDSITDGQNATFGQTPANTMAQSRGDWRKIEYINAGLGSSTLHSNWLPNWATWGSTLYDATAGTNVYIWWRYHNDWNAGVTAAQTETDITTFVTNVHTLGGKAIVCTGTFDFSATSPEQTYINTVNSWMTTGNPSGADFVGDMSPMQTWINANSGAGHLNNAGYQELGSVLAGILTSSGLL